MTPHHLTSMACMSLRERLRTACALVLLACGLVSLPALAQQDDLPGRVGRVALAQGELLRAAEDRPDEWSPIGINHPITTGDSVWVGRDGYAEVDYGGGQFRLGAVTNLHVSRLDDRQLALFVAEGRLIVRIRSLDPADLARVDTPNGQVRLLRPGLYRIDVEGNQGATRVVVREGEAGVANASTVQQVLPGQAATIDPSDVSRVVVANGTGVDGFDTWSASRDRVYERSTATTYVSREMVGYADLDANGSWETSPEYGAVWYPTAVAAGWAPYRYGRWVTLGAWGPTWVDDAPWGYAPFHYGRWVYVGSRWGWCPGTYVARPVWAPALVAWYGGSGWSVSATYGGPVYGWVPLGWREPFHPWWGGCSSQCWTRYNRPYAVNPVERSRPVNSVTYVNWNAPGGVTAVTGAAFVGGRAVQNNVVQLPARAIASAPLLREAPMPKPLPATGVVRAGTNVPPAASSFNPGTRPVVGAPTSTRAVEAPNTVRPYAQAAPYNTAPDVRRNTVNSSPTYAAPTTSGTLRAPATAAPSAPATQSPPRYERRAPAPDGGGFVANDRSSLAAPAQSRGYVAPAQVPVERPSRQVTPQPSQPSAREYRPAPVAPQQNVAPSARVAPAPQPVQSAPEHARRGGGSGGEAASREAPNMGHGGARQAN
jgi:hypothetical protein